MPPRTTSREPPESHPHRDLDDDVPHPSAYGPFVTHTSIGNVGATGGPPESFQSAEHTGNVNFATGTPSVNNNGYQSESGEPRLALGITPSLASVPFRNPSSHYPVLPPISSIYANPALTVHNPSPLAVHPPGALQGQLGILGPPTWGVPPVNVSQRPAIANHARTPSTGSSYYSMSMPSYNPPATLASSVASAPSTNSVPTPNTTGSAYGAPWQPAHPTSASSGHSIPAGGGKTKASFAGTTRFMPIVHAPGDEATPLGSPIRGIGRYPPTASPQLPRTDGIPIAEVPADSSAGAGANPRANRSVPQAGMATAAPTPFPRPGGAPYVSPEEHDKLFQLGGKRAGKTWLLCEYGMIIRFFFRPEAPKERLDKVLAHRMRDAVFTQLSMSEFKGTRSASALQERYGEVKKLYEQTRLYFEHFPGDLDFSVEERLLNQLDARFKELGRRGHSITVAPWHMLVFVRESWYFWISVSKLGNHPSSQTGTSLRSGIVSPAAALSPPPAQDPPPSTPASSRSLPLARLPPKSSSAAKAKSGAQPPATLPAASHSLIPRQPSVSSLRVPRDPPAGRMARKAFSVGGAASIRAPRLARSIVSSSTLTNPTPTQSEAGSVPPAIPPNPPNPPDPPNPPNPPNLLNPLNQAYPLNAPGLLSLFGLLGGSGLPGPVVPRPQFTDNQYTELQRGLNMWEQQELAIASERAKNEARTDAAKLEIIQRAQMMAQAEVAQRMQLERLRAVREDVTSNVTMFNSTMAAQHGMALSTAATLPPTHPLYDEANSMLQNMMRQPTELDLSMLTNQAEARVSQTLGAATVPLISQQLMPAPAPRAPLALHQHALLATPGAGSSRDVGHAPLIGDAAHFQAANLGQQGETSGMAQQWVNAAEVVEAVVGDDDDEGSLYDP
ncbi:hypothetical protein FRC10_002413 [Ceratobasidium sp. 414]|nr:hypothetical protein FRC10_002413 [Ceratobasidium sp. 414]